jgi:hypothetical protein
MDPALPGLVADYVAAANPRLADMELQQQLRAGFGGMRIVVCNDDDVAPNMPAAHGNARCQIYYLDANEHCVRLTREAEAASGLVVGLISDDA